MGTIGYLTGLVGLYCILTGSGHGKSGTGSGWSGSSYDRVLVRTREMGRTGSSIPGRVQNRGFLPPLVITH